LLICKPSAQRSREGQIQKGRQRQLETIISLSALLTNDIGNPLEAVFEPSRQLLMATTLGLYRVSPFAPDYLCEGPLSSEFPRTLPSSAIEPFTLTTLWSLGNRTENELQRAARASGLNILRTVPLGDSEAWIGVLVSGWRDPEDMPDDAEQWMQFIANICLDIILKYMQKDQLEQAQKQKQQLESELEGQFSAVTDALITLDEDLRITRTNVAACHMLGYQMNELEGLLIQDVLVGARDINATFLDALGHQRQAEQPRITIHRRDGTPFPVHLRVFPLSDQSQARLLAVLQDQSEQQAIENQTEILAQRALLGEVTAILAHEVRNPINNISTGVQLVASRLGKDHSQYESLQKLRHECDRLNQLLSDVLFFARPLELKMEPLDLAGLIERLVLRWLPRFRQSNIQSYTNFTPGLPPAWADPRTLEQVILNLITNALQAMPEGGTISFSVDQTTTPQGKALELKIADSGTGIPPHMMDRIFDPFFTTKKEGTGLGLAISRRILSAHKGTISVESYPAAGTVFTIRVPALDVSSKENK
jgi:PAS domain S-box-containing protein